MNETFGKVVRDARNKLNFTVDGYIERLGRSVSRAYISKIELHDEIPAKELIEIMALVLGLDEKQLIELAKDGKRKQFEKSLNSKY